MHVTDVLGLVTARGGSKGLPGKNVVLLGGKPLIGWTIEAAQQSCAVGRIVVSTDDANIADVARQWGAEVPFLRPVELAGDSSPHIDVVCHALDWLELHEGYTPEYVLLLQPTSPLRTAEDIDAAALIAEERAADAVVGVETTHHHPFLVKRVAEDGTLDDFVTSDLAYLQRQVLPLAYFVNGAIFLNRRKALLADRTFFPARTYPYVMPAERSMQIDTPWDLFLMELIIAAKSRVSEERRA